MKIKKTYFVGVDGSIRRTPELEQKELELSVLYPIIGCTTVEHVGLKKGVDMWIDEEGLLKNDWKLNEKATAMYKDCFPFVSEEAKRELAIVGNAIITDNTKAGDYMDKYIN